ncbi:MAG: hypothetical protein DWI10_10065 [Planctomycetota bacterium]|nr:MAG: hypothetical protein DWI10_10065 [Planctomycetota bacterium]
MQSTPIQIFVCDARQASSFQGTFEWPERLTLSEGPTFVSQWEDFHDHHRPDVVGAIGGGGSSGAQRFANQHSSHGQSVGQSHDSEELERRFAREVSAWINARIDGAPGIATVIFAAPRFLGTLRDESEFIRNGVGLYRAEFVGLGADELAEHQTVCILVGELLHSIKAQSSGRTQTSSPQRR